MATKFYLHDIDHTALDLIRQGPAKEVKRPTTNTQPEIEALTVRLLKVKDSSLASGGPDKK